MISPLSNDFAKEILMQQAIDVYESIF